MMNGAVLPSNACIWVCLSIDRTYRRVISRTVTWQSFKIKSTVTIINTNARTVIHINKSAA